MILSNSLFEQLTIRAVGIRATVVRAIGIRGFVINPLPQTDAIDRDLVFKLQSLSWTLNSCVCRTVFIIWSGLWVYYRYDDTLIFGTSHHDHDWKDDYRYNLLIWLSERNRYDSGWIVVTFHSLVLFLLPSFFPVHIFTHAGSVNIQCTSEYPHTQWTYFALLCFTYSPSFRTSTSLHFLHSQRTL